MLKSTLKSVHTTKKTIRWIYEVVYTKDDNIILKLITQNKHFQRVYFPPFTSHIYWFYGRWVFLFFFFLFMSTWIADDSVAFLEMCLISGALWTNRRGNERKNKENCKFIIKENIRSSYFAMFYMPFAGAINRIVIEICERATHSKYMLTYVKRILVQCVWFACTPSPKF